MINILSVAEEQCSPEILSFVKSSYEKSIYGSYYVISTTQFQQPKNQEEFMIIQSLLNLAHNGYSYLMINLNKPNETNNEKS